MGKVIALKLTEKEERIINRLNQEGITSSELLREALWYYFKSVNQTVKPMVNHQVNHVVNQKVNPSKQAEITPKDDINEMVYNYIVHLKKEVYQLREQNNKFQKQLEDEISKLSQQVYTRNITNEKPGQTFFVKKQTRNVDNIHRDVDEFLKKREKKWLF